VQATGIPWDDQSGDELRRWLGVNKTQFYDSQLFVHTSPRNNIWQKKNPWFELEVVPVLEEKIKMIIG
jgi:uracil-DNA glycosylase